MVSGCDFSHNILNILSIIIHLPSSGRAGVPMEVMGLMLGEFVDDYTVRVIDVFAMPQSGTVTIFLLSRSLSLTMSSLVLYDVCLLSHRVLVLKQLTQYFKQKCWTC